MSETATTYSDQFIDWLVELGYTHCFLVAGGNIMHLLNSVRTRMVCVPVVHEVAAGIAAEYFNAVRGPGEGKAFALVTAGPGLTNITTAIAGAWQESRELLVVGGQVKSSDLSLGTVRQRGLQEIDGVAIVASITKAATCVQHPIGRSEVEELVSLSRRPRMGPVFIEMCLDAQAAPPVDMARHPKAETSPESIAHTELAKAADAEVEALAQRIYEASRPVFLIGGGVSYDVARGTLPALVKAGVPLMTTWNGADRVPSDLANYWGRPNTFGQRAANVLLQQADLVVALGTRLGIQQTGFNWAGFAPLAQVVQVEIDEREINKPNPAISKGYVCDVDDLLPRLLDRLLAKGVNPQWVHWRAFGAEVRRELPLAEPANQSDPECVSPYDLFQALGKAANPDAQICPSSSGGTFTVAYQALELRGSQRLLSNKSLASMGYGLSGAIGLAAAFPHRQTILLEGDGGFAQNLQELGTVSVTSPNVTVFILDNNGYASIRMTQRNYFGGAWIGCDASSGLGLPDWSLLARAYGLRYEELRGSDRLGEELAGILAVPGPQLVRVAVDPQQTFYPKITSRVLPDGSMESNPLHLLSPELPPEVAATVMKFLR